MDHIIGAFREFARLDLLRKDSGLSIAELERWKLLQDRLEDRLRKRSGPDEKLHERRSSPRLATHLKCSYRAMGNPNEATVTQLSTGGVYISTQTPLPVGSRLVMHIRLEESGALIEVSGDVVSNNVDIDRRIGRRGMGIKFTEVSEAAITSLSELYAKESCRPENAERDEAA